MGCCQGGGPEGPCGRRRNLGTAGLRGTWFHVSLVAPFCFETGRTIPAFLSLAGGRGRETFYVLLILKPQKLTDGVTSVPTGASSLSQWDIRGQSWGGDSSIFHTLLCAHLLPQHRVRD